ncbi:MAG: dTDP-4-dehydrorhamnose 3,5-epimerase family protein [Cyanobacteria bacterium P01_G01_bin.54]
MSNRLQIQQTLLSGLIVVKRIAITDQRGQFSRIYCQDELASVGFDKIWMQINYSLTQAQGAVRGLHFQHPPYAEAKMVSCLQGEVFDVAVDIRKDSPTFLQWHAEVLSAKNGKSFCIPEGFAHGFQTLTENCELLYFHSAPYQPKYEGALNVRDTQIGIDWQLPIRELSDRDRAHPSIFESHFCGIIL